jgi:hypothetical protein
MVRTLRLALIVTVAGLSATYGWLTFEESSARRVLAASASDRSAAESLLATNRVLLALHRVRQTAYDTAPLQLVVHRQDGTMTLERAGMPLIRTVMRVTWPIGIDTIATVTADTIRSTRGTVISADRAASPTDFRAMTRSLAPGAVIYVQ